ncbi:MAG: hypothetical protein J7577_20580 [Sphingobacteriaceae bacterium]|nr:hypothetical protein [Sphingobacteriaceae bacterium]
MTIHYSRMFLYLLLIIALVARIAMSAVYNGSTDSSWKKTFVKMTDREGTADEDSENEGKIKLSDLVSITSYCIDFTLPDHQENIFSSKDYRLTAANAQTLEYPPKQLS